MFLASGLLCSKPDGLSNGDAVPDFMLHDQDEEQHRLSDYRGQWIVVYFYPKDDTPGCTAEACGLRDNYSKFEKNEVIVLGISYDSPKSHKAFQEKHALPFTLLSDVEKNVSELFGAKGMMFPRRKTFLIDPEGIVRKIYEEVDVTTHATDILMELDKLKQATIPEE